MPPPPYAEAWRGLSNTSWLEQNRPEIASEITSLPWVADGIEDNELQATQAMINIGIAYDSAATIELMNRSWVRDGLNESELSAITQLQVIGVAEPNVGARILRLPFLDSIEAADVHTLSFLVRLTNTNVKLFQNLQEKQWVEDGLQEYEEEVLVTIRRLMPDFEEEALLILEMPFLDTVSEQDPISVAALAKLAEGRVEIFNEIAAKPWVEDGLDEAEIVLVQGLQHFADLEAVAEMWVSNLLSGESPVSLAERSRGKEYDSDDNGYIEHGEAVSAANDYLNGDINGYQMQGVIAVYGYSSSLIPLPHLAELARVSGWYTTAIRRAAAELERPRPIEALEEIDRRNPEIAKAMLFWPWIFDQRTLDYERDFIEHLADLGDEAPELLREIVALPWLAGRFNRWEESLVEDLRIIYSVDPESAALIWGLPWIRDGIVSRDSGITGNMREIVTEDHLLWQEVLNLGLLQEGPSVRRSDFIHSIRNLSRDNSQMAWQIIRAPFMKAPFLDRDEYALRAIYSWSNPRSDEESIIMERLSSQTWFNDGLDDGEAALLHAIRSRSDAFQQDLIQSHHIESSIINLPWTGDVGLAVISHTPFPANDHVMESLEEGARMIEDFVGAPLPVGDLILLVVEPDFWTQSSDGHLVNWSSGSERDSATFYLNAMMRVNNLNHGPSRRTLNRLIANHYLLGSRSWYQRGLLDFLASYVDAKTGGEELDDRLNRLMESPRTSTASNEIFFLTMYKILGPEVVSATIRDLHSMTLFFDRWTDDHLYHSLLSHSPPDKIKAFNDAYSRLISRPVVTRGPEDPLDLAPLVALYNATDGENWKFNRNWLSDAPIGLWHGVVTNSEGRVVELLLPNNDLNGGIPLELGNLSGLMELDLSDNRLTGDIPAELDGLTDLERLYLRGNKLSGELPTELGNLEHLEWLYLRGNQFSGCIPRGLLSDRDDLEYLGLPFCPAL